MSRAKLKQLMESHLRALDPNFLTAYENVNFKPTEAPFQIPTFLFAQPDDRGFAGSPFLQRGIMTIALAYPPNEGAGDCNDKAKSIIDHFPRGLSLTDGAGFVVNTDATPEVTGGNVEGDRFIIRVLIRFFAYIDNL